MAQSELVSKIRDAYPGHYDDMSDDDLEKSVLAKHPEYHDLASPKAADAPHPTKTEIPDNSDATKLVKPVSKEQALAANPIKPSPDAPTYSDNSDIADEPVHEPSTFWGGALKSVGDQLKEAGPAMFQSAAHPQSLGDIMGLLIPSELPRMGKLANVGDKVAGDAIKAPSLVRSASKADESLPVKPDINPVLDSRISGIQNPDIPSQVSPEVHESNIYNIARDKFNMGRDLPEASPNVSNIASDAIAAKKPTATFRGMQETGDPENPNMPLYNVEGGKYHGSTVTADRLKSEGIDIPETPKDAVPLRGDDLRRQALEQRQSSGNGLSKVADSIQSSEDIKPEAMQRGFDQNSPVFKKMEDAGEFSGERDTGAPDSPTLYHGTQSSFDRFDTAKNKLSGDLPGMIHFSEDPKTSELYSLGESRGMKRDGGLGGNPRTIPAKIKSGNVLDLTKNEVPPEQLKQLQDTYPELRDADSVRGVSPQYIKDVINHHQVMNTGIKSPFDAIKYKEYGSTNWAVNPETEIKSTISGKNLTNTAADTTNQPSRASRLLSDETGAFGDVNELNKARQDKISGLQQQIADVKSKISDTKSWNDSLEANSSYRGNIPIDAHLAKLDDLNTQLVAAKKLAARTSSSSRNLLTDQRGMIGKNINDPDNVNPFKDFDPNADMSNTGSYDPSKLKLADFDPSTLKFDKPTDLLDLQARRSAKMDARNKGFRGQAPVNKFDPSISNNTPEKAPLSSKSTEAPKSTVDSRTQALLDKNKSSNLDPNIDSAKQQNLFNEQAPKNKYDPPESDYLTKLANLSSKTTRAVLGFHVPGTAISFHGINEAVRNTVFGPDFNPFNAAGRLGQSAYYLARPGKAADYLTTNLADLHQAISEGGLKITTGDSGVSSLFTGNNPISKGFNALTDPKPLFEQVIPALKLKSYQAQLKYYTDSGMGRTQAAKLAGEATNNIYGGLNLQELQRSPQTQKLFRVAALAPDWLESNMRLGSGMIKALKNPLMPQNRVYAAGIANFLGSYAAMNVMNAMNNDGKFTWQNDVGHELDVAMGKDSKGKTRYFSPYGTALDMIRVPLEIAHAAANGNMGKAFTDVRSRASEPLQFLTDLATNTDYAGRSLFDKTKFGKQMPMSTQSGNIIKDATDHFLPIGANAAADYAQGKISAEEFAAKILQIPAKYKAPQRAASYGR